jgi:hypothetical protein
MSMTRVILGSIAGFLMAVSGVAHSAVGWRALQRTLSTTNVPDDVAQGLAVPWHFAGMAMLLSGVVGVTTVWRMRSGETTAWPAIAVGAAWVLFGLWGLAVVKRDATFLLFIVPGVLLLAAVIRR